MSRPNSPSEILPGLYLGNEVDAGDKTKLDAMGITHIVTVLEARRHLCQYDNFHYKRIDCVDFRTADLASHFDDAAQFIHNALSDRDSPGKVLVHCAFGVSRSATIVIAYLMKHHRLRYAKAFGHVKSCRRTISPNPGFVAQLELYEELGCHIQPVHPKYRTYIFKRIPTNPAIFEHIPFRLEEFFDDGFMNDENEGLGVKDVVLGDSYSGSCVAETWLTEPDAEVQTSVMTTSSSTTTTTTTIITSSRTTLSTSEKQSNNVSSSSSPSATIISSARSTALSTTDKPSKSDVSSIKFHLTSLDLQSPTATTSSWMYQCASCKQLLFRDSSVVQHQRGIKTLAYTTRSKNDNFGSCSSHNVPNNNKNNTNNSLPKGLNKQATPESHWADGGADFESRNLCPNGIHVVPLGWMAEQMLRPMGRLRCPGACRKEIGEFSWAGKRCSSCGAYIAPHFLIPKNKMERVEIN